MSHRRSSAPLALGSHLLLGDYEGYLHVMSIEDGSLVARLKIDGSPIMTAPLELDGGPLVQTLDGDLYSVAIH